MANSIDNLAEEWKTISTFQKYEISNHGKVRNKLSGNLKALRFDKKFWTVSLSADHKNRSGKYPTQQQKVHCLVAAAFIPNTDDKKKFVDHINANRDQNDMTNLRWVTAGQNQGYHRLELKKKRIVLQKSNDDKLIKRWVGGLFEILKAYPRWDYTALARCCSQNAKSRTFYKGYKWEYEIDNTKIALRDLYPDEEFRTIGIFGNFDFSDYQVSDYGSIRNRAGQLLRFSQDRGYDFCNIIDKFSGKAKQIYAHRAVAFKFVEGMTEDKKFVNHIDSKRDNNHFSNLEWVTASENTAHAMGKKIEKLDAVTGKSLGVYGSVNAAAASIANCKDPNGISKCAKGKTNTSYGFKWRFVETDHEHSSQSPEDTTSTSEKVIQKLDVKTEKVMGTYKSIDDAAASIPNCKAPSGISKCAEGKSATSYGFKWRIVDSPATAVA